jgi:hypothetical protein
VDVEQTEFVGSGRRGDELACSMNSERPFVFNNNSAPRRCLIFNVLYFDRGTPIIFRALSLQPFTNYTCISNATTSVTVSWFSMSGPEQRSRYSDSLRTGRYWYRIPVGGRDFPHTSRPALGTTQNPINGYRVFPGYKAVGCGVDHPPHLRAKQKKQ